MTNQLTKNERQAAASAETTRGARVYRPLTDIVERNGAISLMVEMPGVASDDVEITLEKRVLTIRGHTTPGTPEKLQLAYAEYGEGDYERAFTLSDDFDPDRIEAEMKNGLLVITLPKAEAAQPKKISVRSG
jgi:HSP20 family protein